MTDNTLRQRLAVPMPRWITRLPRTKHGLPVPYIAQEREDGSPNLGEVDLVISAHCHRESRLDLWGQAGAAERTFITGPGVFGSDYGCNDPPMHEECAHYALRVCPHLIAPSSVSVVIAPRATGATLATPRRATSTSTGLTGPTSARNGGSGGKRSSPVTRFLRSSPANQRRRETPSHNF